MLMELRSWVQVCLNADPIKHYITQMRSNQNHISLFRLLNWFSFDSYLYRCCGHWNQRFCPNSKTKLHRYSTSNIRYRYRFDPWIFPTWSKQIFHLKPNFSERTSVFPNTVISSRTRCILYKFAHVRFHDDFCCFYGLHLAIQLEWNPIQPRSSGKYNKNNINVLHLSGLFMRSFCDALDNDRDSYSNC